MVRCVLWFSAALVAAALAYPADAQTTTTGTPTLHARARHHHKAHAAEPEGRQITVRKSGSGTNATPSWLTLGPGAAPVGSGNNYVTSTFDQPSPIEGTVSGYRGQERLINRYGVPGAPLFQF